MSTEGLDASFTVSRGTLELAIALRVPAGRVTAIVGPNGAGKSTTLAVLAGLVRAATGRVTLSGEVLDEPASAIHLPTTSRRIGMVFQDYLLFPHLTAIENVAFGLRVRGDRRVDARRTALEQLTRFGLGELADVRPAGLSGGQAQRVALARALAPRPQLLLLDEPLAALDAEVRPGLRADLLRAVREYGGSTVLVTHDAVDAMTLADEVIVLESGVVTHRCAPSELLKSARTAFAADLVGLNFLRSEKGIAETFTIDSVRVTRRFDTSGRADACIVTAVELAPSGIRVRLELAERSGVFWAAIPPGDWGGGVPRMGDRVWAERRLIAG